MAEVAWLTRMRALAVAAGERSLLESLVRIGEALASMTDDLPDDARSTWEAARGLAEGAADELGRETPDRRRVTADLRQIGALADALRTRLLLRPFESSGGRGPSA